MMISGRRKVLATALTLSLLFQQAVMVNALATNISGVSGNNGIYNINPAKIQGSTGFRQYENFNLTKGDIANLIFKYGENNVSQFINLVDNTINIDGIVNTVRDNKFYNGHAVFVSPNGMVVGSSGVLNVGSLSVYTPTPSSYNNYIKTNYKSPLTSLQQGDSNVVINGKVISAGDINIYAKDAAVGATGGLISGAKTNSVLTTEKATDILFNSLVNTNNLKAADTLAMENGNIVIRTTAKDGGIDIAGRVQNNGNGNITIQNNGSKDLNVSGVVKNANGNLQITNASANTNISGNVLNSNGRLVINNNKGLQNIAAGANISNSGDLRITNKGEKGQIINGNVSNDGLTLVSSNAGNTVINGKIINKNGMLTLVSNGQGLEIGKTGEISNNAKIKITNTGKDGFTMNGQVKNSGSTALTNWAGNYIIGGSIENLDGKMNLSNASSKMHLTETSKIVNNGDLQIINSGKDGLTLDGTVENTSTTNVWNVRNDLNVNGTIANSNGRLNVTNDGNALNVGATGNISNNAATYVTNSGEGGLNYSGAYVNSGVSIVENKAGDLNINSTLNQVGNKIVVKNSGNELNINTSVNAEGEKINGGILAQGGDITVFNTGNGGTNIYGNIGATGENQNISITNKAGNFNTNGALITNENGNIRISNSGANAVFMDENSAIDNNNGKIIISNSGKEGARIDAYIKNNGITNITNSAGDLVTNSRIENQNGNLEVVNNGNSLTIGGNALLTNNSDVRIANTGEGGMLIKGDVESNGSTAVSNWAGNFVVSGKVENHSGKMNITSAKESNGLYLTKEGQLLNNDAELLVQNTGKNGMILDGEVKNNNSTTLYNTAGDMKVNGLVQNKGELMISNRGGNLSTGDNAIIKNDGKTTIRNTSIGGMTLGGTFVNQNGTFDVENKAGYLKIAQDAQITNRKADINITNSSGGAMTVSGGIYNLEGDNINISNTSKRGGIVIDETGLVNTQGDVNLSNYGIHGIRVHGAVAGNNVNVGNKDSNVYLGNPNAPVSNNAVANLNAANDVVINLENGSLLNDGTANTLINANKDLTINVNNGKIGVDTGSSGGGYTYGPDGAQVDMKKSINIDVDGKINAHTLDSKGTNGNYAINMASKGSDMNIDHIYAAGRVILLSDAKYDEDKVTTGSILNAATDPAKANIEAKGVSLISSGTIGQNGKPLTINDTNYAYKSDYQAIGDINLKSLDDQYNKADVRYIISNEGNIDAEFTGLARVKDTYAGAGNINVTNRTRKMNLVNKGTTPNTGYTYYNFRGEADIMPIED